MNYSSGQQVWIKHFPYALIVMGLAFLTFNTLQWTTLVPTEAWPYGTSITTAFAYLVSQVLELKVAIFVSTIAAIVVLVLLGMKVRPLLKSAFSPSYKWDTIGILLMFLGLFVALPILGLWAFADIVVTNPHVYINTVIPTAAGAIYFAGKTLAATQFAEARTRATDSVEEDAFDEGV